MSPSKKSLAPVHIDIGLIYCLKNKNNHLVTDVNDVKLEDNLTIQLSKGEIEAQVININPKEKK